MAYKNEKLEVFFNCDMRSFCACWLSDAVVSKTSEKVLTSKVVAPTYDQLDAVSKRNVDEVLFSISRMVNAPEHLNSNQVSTVGWTELYQPNVL